MSQGALEAGTQGGRDKGKAKDIDRKRTNEPASTETLPSMVQAIVKSAIEAPNLISKGAL